MLLCFYTKGSKGISHINCFYFCCASLLCFHSSSLTDVLEIFLSFFPPGHIPHHFYLGSPALALSLEPLWHVTATFMLPFHGAEMLLGGSYLAAYHFPSLPGSKLKTSDWVLLALNLGRMHSTFRPGLLHTPSMLLPSVSPGWMLMPWASQWFPCSANPPAPHPALILRSLTIDFSISKNKLFCVVPLRFGGLILKQLVVF